MDASYPVPGVLEAAYDPQPDPQAPSDCDGTVGQSTRKRRKKAGLANDRIRLVDPVKPNDLKGGSPMTQLPGWDRETSPYHRGEQELHRRLGRKEHQERIGRKIHRPFMPEQHRAFFNQLPFFIAGSVDDKGWPWASILFGKSGFVTTPTDRTLRIAATPIQGDPFFENAKPQAPTGFLGIELPSRRRNRVNGVVTKADDSGIHVDVVQSFGNCPQYIQTRAMRWIRDPDKGYSIEIERFESLDETAIRSITTADTFFVASFNHEDHARNTGGVDVNHRGGQPGFVMVADNVLTIPDYVGNFAFNTLGNFLVNPKAGLLFVDFDNGDLLFLTGTTEVLWELTPELKAFRGAERGWRFRLDHGFRLKAASPMRWDFGDYSPKTLLTGNWNQAKGVL